MSKKSQKDANDASDLITDDEFERLLDELHGPAGGPESKKVAGAEAERGSQDADEVASMVLDREIVIGSVESMSERLRDALVPGQRCEVDAREVRLIDTAGMQFLLAFRKAGEVADIPVVWRAPSAELGGAAALLGLTDELGFD